MTSGIVGERRLWPRRIRNRICSALRSPKGVVVSEWMRQAVNDVYHRQLGLPQEWTPEQRELFLNLVTARLDNQASELATRLGEDAISQWRAINDGQFPDFTTTVGLRETALQNAREAIVRQELYALIPEAQTGPPPVVAWENRWRHLHYQSPPSEQIEDLASHVWADRSPMFQVEAAYLLAARAEEGRPLPNSPHHRLAHQLAPLIEEALREAGHPL